MSTVPNQEAKKTDTQAVKPEVKSEVKPDVNPEVKPETATPVYKQIDALFFVDHLHLMFSKSALISMANEASFEEAFDQKQNQIKPNPSPGFTLEIESMIRKLKTLFTRQTGGGMTLEKLKQKLREKIQKIKPRS